MQRLHVQQLQVVQQWMQNVPLVPIVSPGPPPPPPTLLSDIKVNMAEHQLHLLFPTVT